MIYELSNGTLTVKINSLGAELISAKRGEVEYIWDGDKKWWDDKAPVLFPICGRLPEKKYSYGGKVYDMDIHGFAWKSEFSVKESSQTRLVLELSENEETLKQYPFAFTFTADFSIEGDKLTLKFTVLNRDKKELPYMVGWHPGFNLFGEGEIGRFSLKFAGGDTLSHHAILPGCFVSEVGEDYPAKDSTYVLCEEEIYSQDTMIFTKTEGSALLSSPDTDKRLLMEYSENLPYFCIWKETSAEARFVCLEPWSDIPTAGEAPVAFETRPMSRLGFGESKEYIYGVKFF